MGKEIDEDLIEATIRRVAESKAAREAGPSIEMPVAESIAPEKATADEETPTEPAEGAPATWEEEEDEIEVTPTPLMAASRGRLVAAMSTSASWPAAATASAPATAPVAPPPAEATDIASQLAAITRRLDAIVPLLEKIAGAAAVMRTEDDWQDEPRPLIPVIGHPAPSVLRDQILRPVTAEQTEADVIDTRPIPKPLPPLHVEPKRGFDLLPRNYRITVEDKRRGVDLVPLHRALLSMDGVRDMSLLSYNNGVAIVSLETTDELEPESLRESVSRAMSRDARVEVHNESTMVVKLAEE